MPSPTRIERIRIPLTGGTAPGYLANPGGARVAAILLAHEWWGMTEQVEDVADRLAAAGYLTLAPDLYDGATASHPDEALRLLLAMDRERALHVLDNAIGLLFERGAPKVAVVGFGMGGGLALELARRDERLAAAVSWYGRPFPAVRVSELKAPLLGLQGGSDPDVPLKNVRSLERSLREEGKDSEFVIFPGVGSGFLNDRRDTYREDAALAAWQRMLDFLEVRLRGSALATAR